MGGHAFTASGQLPLSAPRMPPDIYFMLRNHYLHLLSSFYTQVATPIEAPEKASYGDIDILVSLPNSTFISTESLAKVLGAERVFSIPRSPTTSFALPYPNLPNNHVQLDLHLSPPETFHWQLFHQSHGDLWNLLGTAIRPFGLTSNNAGLSKLCFLSKNFPYCTLIEIYLKCFTLRRILELTSLPSKKRY